MSQLTRDYKGAGRRPSPPGGLKEFLLGALAGALLAGLGTALVMHHMRGSASACAAGGSAAQTPAPPAAHTAAAPTARAPAAPATNTRAARPRRNSGKPVLAQTDARAAARAKAAPAQPQYDFYQMLPNLKVIVPPPTAPGATAVGPNGRTEFAGYVLQVGAYRDEAQAQRIVNYLDSLGILAHINPMHDGSATLYRVRIGPIIEQSELNRFRAVLKRIGYPGVLIPGATH